MLRVPKGSGMAVDGQGKAVKMKWIKVKERR